MTKQYLKNLMGGVALCLAGVLGGCGTSELVDLWSDSSYHAPPLNNLLVVSVSRNSVQRRIWEDALSGQLAKHDVAATQSYRLFPNAVPDTNQVIGIVQSNGYDGILVIRRLPTETTTKYQEGYTANEQATRYDRPGDRFAEYYGDLEYAGYVDSQKVDIRAIDLWTTKNEGHMIWSATCKTPEPNSAQDIRPEIVQLVMTELARHRMIASER